MIAHMFDTYTLRTAYKTLLELKSNFLTIHLRPKSVQVSGTFSDKLINHQNVCIFLQGPVLKSDDFTLETIKLYKKLFPECSIVLSTWKEESGEYLNRIKKEKIKIILNTPPKLSGIANINYQICSSKAAIEYAKKAGCEYVLKSRTDQRMYSPSAIEFILNLLHYFPSKKKYKQKFRIMGVSLNTFKYRLYSLSDMLLFGQIDDMLTYFSPPLDERMEMPKPKNLLEVSKQNLCEVYLASNFLKRTGFKLEWTLGNSWKAFAECFLVFDAEAVDLYWPKYTYFTEYRYRTYEKLYNNQLLDFKEWFNIATGLGNKQHIPEETLSNKFDEPLIFSK
jgi:hypothetical protein